MEKYYGKINKPISVEGKNIRCQICGKVLNKLYHDKTDEKNKCFSCYYELDSIKKDNKITNNTDNRTTEQKQLEAVMNLIKNWNIKIPHARNSKYKKASMTHARMIVNALNNI